MIIFKRFFSKFSATKWKLISNLYWAVLGYAVRIISELFVGILVARYLGPEQYGLMNYIISLVGLFSVFATFGLDNIEIRELSRNDTTKEIIIGTAFRLKLVLAFITFFLILVFIHIFEADPLARTMIIVYSLSILLNSFKVIRNYFISIVENKYVIISEIAKTVIGALSKIYLLLIHAPLMWFVLAATFDFLMLASGYIFSYKAKAGQISKWKYDKKIAKYLIRQSFPLLLSGAAVIVYQRIDHVMIRNMIDNTSLGYYSTAAKFADLILFLPIIVSQTTAPLLVSVMKNNIELYNIKRQQFVSIIVWVTIFISVIVSLISHWLVYTTFGREYLASVPVLQVLAFRAVGIALSSSSGQLIIIEDLHKWAVIRNTFGCCICVIMNLLLIPKFGIMGSAWASVLTTAFTGCLANFLIPPYHGILKMQLKALLFGWKELLRFRQVNI